MFKHTWFLDAFCINITIDIFVVAGPEFKFSIASYAKEEDIEPTLNAGDLQYHKRGIFR